MQPVPRFPGRFRLDRRAQSISRALRARLSVPFQKALADDAEVEAFLRFHWSGRHAAHG